MENFINKVENFITKKLSPGEYQAHRFDIKQAAQIELMQAFGGDDKAGTWIDAYSRQFEELLSNPELDLIARLDDEVTRTEALEEIKKKLYH